MFKLLVFNDVIGVSLSICSKNNCRFFTTFIPSFNSFISSIQSSMISIKLSLLANLDKIYTNAPPQICASLSPWVSAVN